MSKISVIIPVHNEEGNVNELTISVIKNLKILKTGYEIIYIDDGSTDNTLQVLKTIAIKNPNINIIELRKNFGKSTALDIGFKTAKGDIVITLDGDLQDDPDEFVNFIKKLNEGFDMVSGWKKHRHDPWHKTLPSRLFNKVTAKITGLKIHDFNCGFKAYKKEVVKNLSIYGEMHRYIPALAYWKGFKVAEIPVKHRSRKSGKSKYGVERFLRGLFDFITIEFIITFRSRPMHFFGIFGFLLMSIGSIASLYLAILWFQRELGFNANIGSIGDRPLLIVATLFIIIGMVFFSTGLLAELFLNFAREQRDIDAHFIKKIYKYK